MRIIGIIVIAVIVTACVSTLPPAGPASEMMDRANSVILMTNENSDTTYYNLQNHLGNQGFTVIESEDNPLTIVTQYKTFGPLMFGVWGSYSMKITATVNDSSIHFTGDLSSGTQVKNSGGKNSPVRSGWNKMVEVAQQFPHEDIYYSRN